MIRPSKPSGAQPYGLAGRLLKSMGVQLLARTAGTGLGFISISVVARYLSPEGYGELSAALALFGIFATLSDFGVGSVVLRRANVAGESLAGLVRLSVGLSIYTVVPLVASFLLAAHLLYSTDRYTLLWQAMPVFVLGLVATSLSSCMRPLYQQQARLGFVALAELATTALCLTGYGVIARGDLPAVGIFYVQAFFPVLFLGLLVLGQGARHLRPDLRVRPAWRLARDAAWVGSGMLVAAMYLRVDVLILTALADSRAVGNYGIAFRIISAVAIIPVYVNATLYPHLARLRSDGPRFSRALTRALSSMFALALPVAVGGALVAEPLVLLVSGSAFADAISPLRILCLGLLPSFLNNLLGGALLLSNRAGRLLALSCGGLLVNVLLNYALIPRYGVDGAAAATLISETSTCAVALLMVRRDVHYRAALKAVGRVAASVTAMAAVVALVVPRLGLLAVVLGALVYAACSLALGLRASLGFPSRRDL